MEPQTKTQEKPVNGSVNRTASTMVPGATNLPEPVRRRNLTEATWRTLVNSVFPGASNDSILMAVDYCQARDLDVLKKPCHIVPMNVKDSKTGNYEWRDVILPGIYEYRTTAQRTGQYLGHSRPVFGPEIDFKGVKAPEYCEMTMFRWNAEAKQKIEYPVRVYFREAVVKKKDGTVNAMWTRRPIGQLTKCTEAAGLREAFPDELGGEPTADEMAGRVYEGEYSVAAGNQSASEKTQDLNDALNGKKQQDAPPPPPAAEQEAESGGLTYEDVVQQIHNAKDTDDLDVALDAARELPDSQLKQLQGMAQNKRARLNGTDGEQAD